VSCERSLRTSVESRIFGQRQSQPAGNIGFASDIDRATGLIVQLELLAQQTLRHAANEQQPVERLRPINQQLMRAAAFEGTVGAQSTRAVAVQRLLEIFGFLDGPVPVDVLCLWKYVAGGLETGYAAEGTITASRAHR
jgi:hypothetical protein